ncbi:MAG TPA: LLM class flavin-dependent oxidoreductase [Dehalococcoidia bacterium]|jgi:probable F420-dependent oxidoreductase|nr:LLM class flavin-dependent oxidoreductase [Dehalococcoidia bacterium]
MAAIELGLFLSSQMQGQGSMSFQQLLEVVQRAEDGGFHSVWWPDHYFIRGGPGRPRGSYECWTLLTALAARTSRIKLGSLVLCNTFRHPAILAKQANSLQDISGGRVILGLGSGWHEPEYQALGLPFDHRVSRVNESAAALRELFDTGTSSFEGRWLKLDDAVLTPEPAQKVPLWIAGSGPKMLDVVARYADGWNLAWFGGNPERFARKAAELREKASTAGRSIDQIELTVGVQALVAPRGGGEQAIAAMKQANPALAQQSAEQIRQSVLVGDAGEVAAGLKQYADAGARLAIVAFPGLAAFPADPGALDRLLHEVPAALG